MLLKSLMTGVRPNAGVRRIFGLKEFSFAAVGAALFIGQVSPAAAVGGGCTYLNGLGTFTIGANNNPGGITGFVADDVIVISTSTPGPGVSVGIGSTNVRPGNLSTGPTIATYTVTAATAGNTYYDFATNTSGNPATFTYACTHVPGSSTKVTTTPSDKLAAVVVATTKTVAYMSSQVITNQVQAAIDDAFSATGTPTNFGPNGGFINFAAEPEQTDVKKRADDAFAALGYAADKSPKLVKATPRLEREWSAWADIRGTGWKVNDTTGLGNDLKGNQVNVTAGLGRKLDPDTLIGVVVGYENFKYDVAALAGSLKGDGESIGAYFGRRLGGTLKFDAMVGWTHLNYNAVTGAATGSFTGGRWVASTGLTATYKFDMYVFEPSAKVYALWENEKAWTDSLGTAMAARNFSAGRTALGAKVGRAYSTANSWTLTPTVGFYGDYRFQTDNALPTGTVVGNIASGWSGRATAGLSSRGPGGCVISLDGEYGGIGANYKIWTGSARATMPF